MKKSNLLKNVFFFVMYVSFATMAFAQTQNEEGFAPTPVSPVKELEFLGWNYETIGFTLNPSEQVFIQFRNNQDSPTNLPLNWSLQTYTGTKLTSGESTLVINPGQTVSLPIEVPAEMNDGAYKIIINAKHKAFARAISFHFDYRKPQKHENLNIRLVSFIENMDSEGWVRMMMGSLAKYADIRHDFPENPKDADAVVVIAEALDAFNPRLTKLQNYVREGGVMIIFGQPAPVLSAMLPVTSPGSNYVNDRLKYFENPQTLKTLSEGPWQNFYPQNGPLHYGMKVVAKPNSKVLAEWFDPLFPDKKGTPAVVKGTYGKGKVIYVGTGSGQVWQHNTSMDGIDELALRLLLNEIGGENLVLSMMNQAKLIQSEKDAAEIITRDLVLSDMKVKKPNDFVVVNNNNTGRFGWTVDEGLLIDNMSENGTVSPLGTRDWKIRGGATLQMERQLVYNIKPTKTSAEPISGNISQNWFSKTIEWKYPMDNIITSTVSVGSPAILWEGKLKDISLNINNYTHVSFISGKGIKVIAKGDILQPDEMKENWVLVFNTNKEVQDMPLLVVFTRKPKTIGLNQGIEFTFGNEGFGALFSSRIWGIQRLSPGETTNWLATFPEKAGETTNWLATFPEKAITDARRWSQVFLNYPVNCDEIGWVEGENVLLADRFSFKKFNSEWKTKAKEMICLPPVFFLAKNAGAPVKLPEGLIEMNCNTKYGPLFALNGSSSLTKIPVPLTDHRAIVPVDGRMKVQKEIDHLISGLYPKSLQYSDNSVRNEGPGSLQADLIPYDLSRAVPYYEAPSIDLYKWWYTFNATQVRQVYGDSARQVMDNYHRTRYLETLNFYSHKSFVAQKREPYTLVEYPITFVWPTQTQFGFRNFNDANEAAGHNAYCLANYARYYGDWTTLKANWNLLRYMHDPLSKYNDWAVMSSGSNEYWATSGLDMLNSETFGSLAYAYSAELTGNQKDVVLGKVLGVRSLIPTVARFDLQNYLTSISREGDAWRGFKGFYHFSESGLQLSKNKMGSIGMLDTSKGTYHELALAYKMWSGQRMNNEQIALAGGCNRPARSAGPDVTQRLFLGWNIDSISANILNKNRIIDYNKVPRWQESTSLYDLAILCVGDIPLFLSEWAPAELLDGNYNAEIQIMKLSFRSALNEKYTVRIYSQYQPDELKINNVKNADSFKYDSKNGWLEIYLKGVETNDIEIKFGKKVAPLHPYFTKIDQ